MRRQSHLLGITLLFFLFGSIFITNPTQQVVADETEEVDGFTTAPNYRWLNQSTTDSNVNEQIIGGDYYDVNNVNLNPTDTQKFVKSRSINSRDMYFDSRFMVETGGNETEYFRDVLGNEADFSDQSDTIFFGTDSDSIENGLMVNNNPRSWLGTAFLIDLPVLVDSMIWDTVKFRLYYAIDESYLSGYSDTDYFFYYFYARDTDSQTFNEPFIFSVSDFNQWVDVELDVSDWAAFGGIDNEHAIDRFYVYLADSSFSLDDSVSDVLYTDYIQVIGDLDYATSTEGEIEDTWNWDDSNEYFYNEELDISDFNDGTTENYIASTPEDTKIEVVDGWLCTESNKTDTSYIVKVESLSIDSSVYRWFTAEVYIPSDSAYNLTAFYIYDADGNPLTGTVDDVNNGTYGLISIDLGSDGDWSGTETKLLMRPFFDANGGVGAENKINYNFTFLYDCELGDMEGWVGLTVEHTNPDGYYSGMVEAAPNDFIHIAGINIPVPELTTWVTRIRCLEDGRVRFRAQDSGGTWFYPDGQETTVLNAGVWKTITYDLKTQNTDELDVQSLRLYFYDYSGGGDLDGDEIFQIDYMFVLGNFSKSSEFKFSLLNNEDEEGLSIGFNRFNYTNNDYYLNISIYDSIGIVDTYSTTFTYDYQTDGWLLLDFELDLDKKELKFLLEYENGSDIFKTREFTDLFYIGTQSLLLFQEGFPQLCMNASTDPFERVWFLIDYIDANWDVIEWRNPSGSHTSSAYTFSNTFSQDVYDFDAISPYGVSVYKQDTGSGKEQWYMLDVDRFDGLSFDIKATGRDLDIGDNFFFHFEAYNIHENGTPEWVFTLIWNSVTAGAGGGGYSYIYVWLQEDNDLRNLGFTTETQYYDSSMSFYYESPEKVVLQTTFDTNETEIDSNQMTFKPINENDLFTKEWVFYHGFSVENTDLGYSDDEISLKIAGFDVVRKDLLGDIAGAVLDPIVNALSVIFAPVIAILVFVGSIINRGLKTVSDLLGPLIILVGGVVGDALTAGLSALSGVLDVALGAIDDALGVIGGFIEDVGTFIEEVGNAIAGFGEAIMTAITGGLGAIFDAIGEIAEEVAIIIVGILEWIFTLLLDVIELLIDLLAAGLIWIWDELLGFPDMGDTLTMLLEMVLGIPQLIADLAEWIFFFGTFLLVGWWAWCVLIPILSLNPGEAFGVIMERFFKGIFPWDILGIHFYIPQGVVMVGLTYFLIIVPSGAGIAIW